MRRTLRILLRSLLFIPFLATCGGEDPGVDNTPAKLAVVLAPPPSVAVGAPFTVQVQVVTGDGTPVEAPGLEVMASVSAGRTLAGVVGATTDVDGRATFDGVSITGPTGPVSIQFAAEGLVAVTSSPFGLTAGAPAALTVTIADTHAVQVTRVVASAMQVHVSDAGGNPVAGASVAVTIAAGGGSLDTNSVVTARNIVSNGAGNATVGVWRVGPQVGPNRIRFTSGTAPAESLTVRSKAGPFFGTNLVDLQPGPVKVGTLYPARFRAVAVDEYANPLAGIPLTFTTYDDSAGSITGTSGVTDSTGGLTLGSWQVGHKAWINHYLRVSGPVPGFVEFPIFVTPDAFVRVVALRSEVTALRGSQIQVDFRTVDRYGNGVELVPVDGKWVSAVDSLSWSGTSQSAGLFSPGLTMPASAGVVTVRAVSPLAPDSGATAVVQVKAPVAILSMTPDSQSVAAGDTIPVPLRVRVIDSAGSGVAGVPVQFEDAPSGPLRVTDSTGEAVATSIVARTTVSPYRLKAVSPWLSDSVAWTVLPHVGPAVAMGEECCGGVPTAEVGSLLPGPIRGVYLVDRMGLTVRTGYVHFTALTGSIQSDSVAIDSVTGVARPVGWRLDTLSGEQHLVASYGALTPYHLKATATAGPVTQLAALPGHAVTGFVGEPVAYGLDVQARDRYGNPAAGRGWTPLNGAGGTTAGGIGTFDAAGRAYVIAWILGSVGAGNTVAITAGSDTLEVAAEGVAPSAFDIQVRGAAPQYSRYFRQAAFEWRRRIVGDIPNLNVNIPAGVCTGFQASVTGTVDDLIIDVNIGNIDGPGGILGGATPCIIRTTGGLPLLGWMQFDAADLAVLEAEGTLKDVVLHEMGHVLGIGSLWDGWGLVSGAGTADPRYTGAGGQTGFVEIGGAAGTVPVENTGGTGTRDAHWRESVMPSELMTGYLSALVNPMSLVTVRSLADFGYVVDLSRADAYTVGMAPMPAPGRPPRRIRDFVERPRFTVDQDGTVRPTE